MSKSNTKKYNCKCANCGIKMYKYPSFLKANKVFSCSRECNYEYKNKKQYNELTLTVGEDFSIWLKDKYHKEKMSTNELAELVFGEKDKQTSIITWMKRLDIPTRSISEAMSGKLNKMYGVRGADHPNYDSNISDGDRKYKRNYPEYNAFRKNVYERDRYTCQVCSDDTGGNLVVHHLNGYHWDVTGRLEIENGITLCSACHKDFHSIYGYRENDLFQFSQFKKSHQSI